MANVRITLERIECHETEDYTGADEFYVLAGFKKNKTQKAKITKTKVWKLNNGDKIEPKVVLFDEKVDSDEESIFEIFCFDRDGSEDISEEELRKAEIIAENLIEKVNYERLKTEKSVLIKSELVKVAIEALFFVVRLLMNLDKDDLLGKDIRYIKSPSWIEDILGGWMGIGGNKTWTHNFKCLLDGSNYDVVYTVTLSA